MRLVLIENLFFFNPQICELKMKLCDMEGEVESTRESFEAVSNQRFEAQKKMRSALLEKEAAEEKVKALEEQLSEATSQCQTVQSLEEDLEIVRKDAAQNAEKISDLTTDLALAQSELTKTQAELQEARRQREEAELQAGEATSRAKLLGEHLEEFSTGTRSQLETVQVYKCSKVQKKFITGQVLAGCWM